MNAVLMGALSWEPNIKGGLYVLIAVVILCGSAQLLLSTNMGSRLGFQLAAAGLFGFFVIIGAVWWVYGIGPKGPDPTWKPQLVATGDLGGPVTESNAGGEALEGFPKGWRELELTDPEVADAQPVADLALPDAEDGTKIQYLPVAAYTKGGEDYGPLGIKARPLDVFHEPHFLVIQMQPVLKQEAVSGQAPPKPKVDPAAEPVAVVMLRDLG
ncbi:MAG: hypothetical protein ACRD0Q_01660, partial [Acidimicrobiales bacterium]